MNRPAMREVLDYIDKHPHKKFVLVFDDLKRFARDVEFHFKLRATFDARDVMLRCLNYTFDDSPEGRFAELIMAGQAELERLQNKRQVIQKQKARLEKGYWAFNSKRGYQMTKHPEHGKISIPIKKDAQVLQEALEGFANGTFRRKIDVCRFLVDKGFWKNQAPKRYLERIGEILKDPFYAGYIEYPVWEVSIRAGKHVGIINLETFNKIQKRLRNEETGKRIRVDTSEDFPLRGVTVCASCDRPLTGSWTQGRSKKYAYYFCQNKACAASKNSIPKDRIETDFTELLKKQTLSSRSRELVEIVFQRVWEEEMNELSIVGDRARNEQRELEKKIGELTDLIISTKNVNVKQAYESQLEKTAEELAALQVRISANPADMSVPYRTAIAKAIGLLENPHKIWVSLDVIEKQRLFFFIFDDKLAYSKKAGYRTDNLRCAVWLFEDFVTSNTGDVDTVRKNLNQLKEYLRGFWEYYSTSPKLQNALGTVG